MKKNLSETNTDVFLMIQQQINSRLKQEILVLILLFSLYYDNRWGMNTEILL